MDWNDNTNKVTVGIGILIAIVVVYAIYRVATRNSRGSGMYRTNAQQKRIDVIRTISMVLLAALALGAIIWLLTIF